MRPFLLLALLLLPAAAGGPAAAEETAPSVESISVTVGDLDRSVRFYTEVLDFERVGEVEVAGAAYERLQGVFGLRMRIARLRLGDERFDLVEYLAPEGRPLPADARSNDRAFQHIAIVVRDMKEAYARLRKHRVRHASSGPQRLPDWNPAAGGIEAFYFKDPDGHALEVIRFPEGKGDPRWWKPTERLFLGIDHTAIVVRDTEASLRFYRDALGGEVKGGAENWGEEQEHLNNVFGARLRITLVRMSRGPGIELLEYLAPGDGRDAPLDTRANDLWHWQVRVRCNDPALAASKVRGTGRWVSPGAVDLPTDETGFRKGALVRDPDGHAVLLSDR